MLSISWSSLRTHMECKRKSALIRDGKRPATRDLRMFYHGMVVDRLMRDWLADPDRQPGQMLARLDDAMGYVADEAAHTGDGVVRWRTANDRKELRDFCAELLTRLEPMLVELVLPHWFAPALRFKEQLIVPYLDGTPTPIFITGEIDILVANNLGEYVVWDLKATADEQYHRKVFGQLVFYDLAVALRHATRTSQVGLIQPMCEARALTWSLTDDQRNHLLGDIARMAADIWRDERTCKESTSGCAWCEVRHACTRFDPADGAFSLAAELRKEAR